MSSMAPAYRPTSVPRDGDSPDLSKGTDENGSRQSSAASASSKPAARAPKLRPQRRQRVRPRHLLRAWSVSLLVHVVILSALAAATFSAQDKNKKPISFDSALAGYRQGEREELNIWADPAAIPRDQAVGNEHGGASGGQSVEMSEGDGESDDGDGGGMVVAATFGSGAPSTTPRFRGTGKRGINEGNSLPNFKIEGMGGSPLSMLPSAPAADLYGGGKLAEFPGGLGQGGAGEPGGLGCVQFG